MKLYKPIFMCAMHWLLILFLKGIVGCAPKAKDKIYTKASSIVTDSLLNWFNSESNYAKPQLNLNFVYNFYNKLYSFFLLKSKSYYFNYFLANPVKKSQLAYFLFIIASIAVFSCKKGVKKDISETAITKKYEWYAQKESFENQDVYREKFLAEYNNCLKNKQYDNAKVLLFNYANLNHIVTFEYDSLSFVTVDQFLAQNYNLKKDTTYAKLYYIQGWRYHSKNNYEKALQLANECLNINQLSSKALELNAQKLIGICYYKIAQPERAIKTFTELLPLAEELGSKRALGSLHYNIAYCYDMLHANNEAEKMYKMAANNFLAAKDTTTYFAQLCFIATNNFERKNDTLNTLKLIDSILVKFKEYSKPIAIDFAGINKIKTYRYFLTQQYDSAFYYNNKNIDFFENENQTLLEYQLIDFRIYNSKYKKLKDKAKLLKLLDEFLAIEDYLSCIDIYHILYENAFAQNNLKEAIFYRNKEIELDDRLLKANQKGQLFEFEKKYESEKKEKELILKEKTLKDKNRTIALLFTAIGFIVLAALAYRFWLGRKKIIKEKRMADLYTKQLFEKTEEERQRIASDLHDSISHELMGLKNSKNEDANHVNQKIDSIINDIRIISRNLHPVLFEKVGLQNTIEQMVDRVQQQNNFMLHADINYSNGLPKSAELQVYRIVQEAVTNMVKYSAAVAGKINITETTNQVIVEIKDNGKGFDVDTTLNSGNAFGLYNIIERSKAIGGKATIVSVQNGTTISVTITKIKL
jgi:two-component system, NarL family, sensor kinase